MNFNKKIYTLIQLLLLAFITVNAQSYSERIKSDASFFGNGCYTGVFSDSGQAYNCIAKQGDDKFIIAGYTNSIFKKRTAFFIREFINGKKDKTFGYDSTAVFAFTVGTANMTEINDIAVQSDGKIIAVGTDIDSFSNENIVIIRLTKDGDIDTTFADSGYVEIDYKNNVEQGVKIKIQEDGKYIIAGHTLVAERQHNHVNTNEPKEENRVEEAYTVEPPEEVDNENTDNYYSKDRSYLDDGSAMIIRLFPSGKTDSSFGENGIVHFNLTKRSDVINDILIQKDGKIVAVGNCNFEDERKDIVSDSGDIFTIRLLPNGNYDKTFNKTGLLIQDINNEENLAKKVFITNNNKTLVLGMTKALTADGDSAKNNLLFIQYNEDGTLDKSFGKNGYIINNILAYDILSDAFITSDNKIVAMGLTEAPFEKLLSSYIDVKESDIRKIKKKYKSYPSSFMQKPTFHSFVARFKQDGTLDSSLYRNGKILSTFHEMERDFRIYSLLPLSDNNIIGVGMADSKYDSKFLVKKIVITLDVGELKCTKETSTITAYPNPVQQETKVKYSLCADENVSLFLYDLQGKQIHTFLNNELKEKGLHEEILTFPNEIPNGNYLIVFQTNIGVTSVRILVVK